MIWGLTLLFGGTQATGTAIRSENTEVELVTEVSGVQPGVPFWVALRMKMDAGWHTYWKNPGTAGLATAIKWELPPGFIVEPLQWPVPQTFDTSGLVNYGYEGEVFLLTQMTPPEEMTLGQDVIIQAQATWLECKESCSPGKADLTLRLPVQDTSAPWQEPWREAFEATRTQHWPQSNDSWQIEAYKKPKKIKLILTAQDTVATQIEKAYFFSFDARIDPNAPQSLKVDKDSSILELKPQSFVEGGDTNLPGVLYILNADGEEAYLKINPPLLEGISLSLLGLALAGGFILNLMPCVFPILGLKVMSFVQHAGASRFKVALHGLVFTLGILISFWVLAGILIALRAGGRELGWGFQLQSPAFVWTLTAILFVFGLNMSGVFEVGQSAVGVGKQITGKNGIAGTFFSGVLATVVATPCSAPFLAPALGIALALNAVESLIVFSFIGLGLSLPYLLLSFFPRLIELLPRPGPWMETLKQIMAFLLYASAAFLLWILVAQVGEHRLLNTFIGLVIIAIACWVYGRWGRLSFGVGTRFRAKVATLGLLAGGLYLGYAADSEPIKWVSWSAEKVAALRAEGRPVYIDFTARWCATCQVNKRVVFSSKAVRDTFHQKRIATLKADWTQRNPEITAGLESFGRSAVPLNVLYIPGKPDPIILPEILTPSIMLKALEALP